MRFLSRRAWCIVFVVSLLFTIGAYYAESANPRLSNNQNSVDSAGKSLLSKPNTPARKNPNRKDQTPDSTRTRLKPRTASWTTVPVGHGDAHVLRDEMGRVAVVDTASTEAVSVLIDYLGCLDVEQITTLVITHPHWDHIGGSLALMENFEIQKIWKPGLHRSTDLHRRVKRKIKQNDIPVQRHYRGDTALILPTIMARIHNPKKGMKGNLNQKSMAFDFEIKGTRFLFMGDVVGSVERDLLKQERLRPSPIVKAAHHGDAKGLTEEFIKIVQPRDVIIPAPLRKNDPWGLPSPELIDRLRGKGISYHHTGRDGFIHVEFPSQTGGDYRVSTFSSLEKACRKTGVETSK